MATDDRDDRRPALPRLPRELGMHAEGALPLPSGLGGGKSRVSTTITIIALSDQPLAHRLTHTSQAQHCASVQ